MAIPVNVVEGTIETVVEVGNIDYLTQVNEIVHISDIDNVNSVDLVDLVTAVTNVDNVNSVDLVDLVTAVTNVDNVNSVDLVDAVTNVDNVNSVDLVDLVTAVTNVDTVNTVSSVTELVKESDGTVVIVTANTGTANTPVQLAANAANKFVIIRSRDDNDTDQPIWVGHDSDVDAQNSANGYPLDAGESIRLPIENSNLLYVDSQTANQDYSLVVV